MSFRQVIGIHSCKEALKIRTAKELKNMYVKLNWNKNSALKELVHLAQSKNLKPKELSVKKLNRILKQKEETHQGVCVELDHSFHFNEISFSESATVLVLDRIQDPKNLGAIIRTAWLLGVDCIFISSRRSVHLTSSVIKTASGGVEHVPVFIKDSLRQCLEELKENGFWLYALDSQSHKSIFEENLRGPKAFLFGGEHSGVRTALKSACDKILSIPQKDKSASYNVSVAVAIVLSSALKQN